MIVYRDMAFCMRECGQTNCVRNKATIPWENRLPVSFMRCEDCVNWKPIEHGKLKNYYVRGEQNETQ